jgi:hypothetical protein
MSEQTYEEWVRERAAYYGVPVESLEAFLSDKYVAKDQTLTQDDIERGQEIAAAQEPEKPVDERCTCWSPDGGHDGDCAVWEAPESRKWPPETLETKAGPGFVIKESHYDADGTRIIDEMDLHEVSLHSTEEKAGEYPPPSAETVEYPRAWSGEAVTHASLKPSELSIGEWRAFEYRQEHGWPCEECGLYNCSCPQLGYN